MEFNVFFDSSVDKIKFFVGHALDCKCDIDISSADNHYTVDGKSIIGILSLDIAKPLKVIVNDENICNEFKKKINSIIVR